MGRQYNNFDIIFDADGPTYRATFASLEDRPSVSLGFPLDEPELEAFLGMFGKHQRRRMESPELARATGVGRRLFDVVFDDELRGRFLEAINDAKRDRRGLRIRLDLSHADDLITLPWEYLYRIEGDDFVALSNYTPVVRYLQVGEPLPPAPLDGPLRILVMISDPIERRGTLDVEREWQQLQQSLRDEVEAGDVVLTRLPDGRLESLQTALQVNDYHVFHFIGHGEFSEVHDDGVLVMEDARARETHVPGRLLGDYLRDCLTMRLVVLNNCEGAATSESDPFAGSAQSLLRKGLPAVVAMQFEITDQAAIDFARGFYVGLMNGFPVEGALAEARKTMRRGPTIIEFGSPVLYMSADDGVVFERAEPSELPLEESVQEPPPTPAAPGADAGQQTSVSAVPKAPQDEIEDSKAVAPVHEPPIVDAGEEEQPSVPGPPIEPAWKRPWILGSAAIAALVAIVAIVSAVTGTDGDGGTTVTTSDLTTTTVAGEPIEPTLQVGVQETFADRLVAPIVIDGSDDEWTSRFSFESNELIFNRDGSSYDGPDDLSSEWRAAWDEEFLYLYVEVLDDVLSQTRSGTAVFNGDALGIYFDPDLSNNEVGGALRSGEHSGLFLGRHRIWVKLEPDADGGAFGGTGAVTDDPDLRYTVVEVDGGYHIEARIPWSLLRVVSPRAGMTFRMTRDVSDSDVLGGDSLQQSMVSNSPGRDAANQGFPEVWPLLTLLGAEDEPPEPGPPIVPR